ncbi:MAG: 2-amino-4-hydroxy-6-hydroxymethyldihydropteridine diphosphokinase [Chitinophagales bacterium]|nr:2-amino-4-hydroxy-6-hydroxymethyldihydropteridine diphosphokinase [Chitinophagales bacterium]
MRIIVLAGSNVEPRLHYLQQAVKGIEETIGAVEGLSSVYETEPWGDACQPWFLNAAVKAVTSLSPHQVLRQLHQLEQSAGRQERSGPRPLDLDLIFYEQLILSTPELTLPHPRLHLRRFTLVPLAELVPKWTHPVLRQTIEELLSQCTDRLAVKHTDYKL